MRFLVRAAGLADIRQMAALIGATANPISREELAMWMDGDSAWSAWHVAEDAAGALIGLQWIGPATHLPRTACDIATFLADSPDRRAAGSRLIEASAVHARLLGYDWIGAAIGAENEAARIYYQSHGFRDAGRVGEKPLLRFDLD